MGKPYIIERYNTLIDGWEFLQDYNENEEGLAIEVVKTAKQRNPKQKLRLVKVILVTE